MFCEEWVRSVSHDSLHHWIEVRAGLYGRENGEIIRAVHKRRERLERPEWEDISTLVWDLQHKHTSLAFMLHNIQNDNDRTNKSDQTQHLSVFTF